MMIVKYPISNAGPKAEQTDPSVNGVTRRARHSDSKVRTARARNGFARAVGLAEKSFAVGEPRYGGVAEVRPRGEAPRDGDKAPSDAEVANR